MFPMFSPVQVVKHSFYLKLCRVDHVQQPRMTDFYGGCTPAIGQLTSLSFPASIVYQEQI